MNVRVEKDIPTATGLPTATSTETSTPTVTATNTSSPTATAPDTVTATPTPLPTQTSVPTFTSTNTPSPTAIPPTATSAPLEPCTPKTIYPAPGDAIISDEIVFRWLPCDDPVTARRGNAGIPNNRVYALKNNNVIIQPIKGTSFHLEMKNLPGAATSRFHEWSVGACIMEEAPQSVVPGPSPPIEDCNFSKPVEYSAVQASSNSNSNSGMGSDGSSSDETEGKSVTAIKYYIFNGQKIAMRICPSRFKHDTNCQLRYLHADHLGSILMTTDLALGTTEEQRVVHRRYVFLSKVEGCLWLAVGR